MPHSMNRRTTRIRASYTGEVIATAKRGIFRNGDLGIDRCDHAQLEMRSQLAWHLFNTGPFSALPPGTDVARLACYGITVSPRFDGLVVFADAPENVTDCFFFGQHRPAFPGLRLAHSARWHTYEAIHLPTGGKLTVTKDRLNRPIRDEDHEHRRGPSPEVALNDWELTALEHIPPMSLGIKKMLAGIVARFTASAPDNSWATGTWYLPPSGRPAYDRSVEYSRRLTGAENAWMLQWSRFPTMADIVKMLTDPVFGLPGLEALSHATFTDLRLGDSTLRLEHMDDRRWRIARG